jgi:hypothetical protein
MKTQAFLFQGKPILGRSFETKYAILETKNRL